MSLTVLLLMTTFDFLFAVSVLSVVFSFSVFLFVLAESVLLSFSPSDLFAESFSFDLLVGLGESLVFELVSDEEFDEDSDEEFDEEFDE